MHLASIRSPREIKRWEAGARGLRGDVLRAFEEAVGVADGGRVHGIAVGSWQDCSVEIHSTISDSAHCPL